MRIFNSTCLSILIAICFSGWGVNVLAAFLEAYQQLDTPELLFTGDGFGSSVDISGNTAVVGAPSTTIGGIPNGGVAWIYEKDANGGWGSTGKIADPVPTIGDRFGASVGVFRNHVIVGEPYNHTSERGVLIGTAWVFEKLSGGGWGDVFKLEASDASADDQFGFDVAIAENVAVVSAPNATNATAGNSSGAVYVFERTPGTNDWTETDKLLPGAISGSGFGFSVGLSEDGNTIIIGGGIGNVPAGFNPGSIWIFERNSNGSWSESSVVVEPGQVGADDGLGFDVGVSGNVAIAGAPFSDNPDTAVNSGAALIFRKDSLSGSWIQTARLALAQLADDHFGMSVAISGNTAIIGAPDANGDDRGSVWVYEKNSDDTWDEPQQLITTDTSAGDRFGVSVALSSGSAIVGAENGEIDPRNNTGSAYLFKKKCIAGNGFPGDGCLSPVSFCFKLYPNQGQLVTLPDGRLILVLSTTCTMPVEVLSFAGGITVAPDQARCASEKGQIHTCKPEELCSQCEHSTRLLKVSGDVKDTISLWRSGEITSDQYTARLYQYINQEKIRIPSSHSYTQNSKFILLISLGVFIMILISFVYWIRRRQLH